MADYTRRPSGGGPMPPPRFQTESPIREPRPSNGRHSPATSSTRSSSYSPTPRSINVHARTNASNIDPRAPTFASNPPTTNQGRPPQTAEAYPGGFAGDRKTVPRNSRRDSERSKHPEEGAPYGIRGVRDSGYDSASRIAQSIQPPPWPMNAIPPRDSPHAPLQPPLRDQETEQYHYDDDASSVEGDELRSPHEIPSPVTVELEYAESFMSMSRTPPPSDTSFNTYLTRFREFVHEVRSLPWVATKRVTADYYPAKSSRRRRRHPAISWHSQEFDRDIPSSPVASGDSPTTPVQYMAPQQGTHAGLDLGDEFGHPPQHGPPPAGPPPAVVPPPGLPPGASYPVIPGGPPLAYGFPQFPGGYVHPSRQHVGWQYGAPFHMSQPPVMMGQPIYVSMPSGSYLPVQ